MPKVADYMVLRDKEAEVSLEESLSLIFTFPADAVEVSGAVQRPILMFKVRSRGESLNATLWLNGDDPIVTLYNSEPMRPRTYHEVLSFDQVLAKSTNTLYFAANEGDPDAKFFISDIVIWFQRDAFWADGQAEGTLDYP